MTPGRLTRSTSCTFRDTRDQERAARIEHPDGPVRATAVLAHGLGGPEDPLAARGITGSLARHGLAVLSFDASSGDADDVEAAARHLADVERPPVLLVGHASGGAAALAAATRLDEVQAVATIAAPAEAATLQAVAELPAALLVLHAPLDDTVGIHHARELFVAARRSRSFVSLDGADHLLSVPEDARYAADVIASWAARHLPADPGAARSDGADEAVTRGAGGDYADGTVVATNHEGLATRVAARGFAMQVDEPRSVGGTETGPTPYEYLGAALAACTSMTLRLYAERKDYPLDEVSTSVVYDRVHAQDCVDCESEDHRIHQFTRAVTLVGDLDDAQRQRLLSIASRCPVHRTLEGEIEILTALAGA